MPRTNVCSEVTVANIRLAVRQAVADFCASPDRTIEDICIILSPSNEPPPFESVLRFLSKHNDESEKDIVQRFERNVSSEKQRNDEWQKSRTLSSIPTSSALANVDIPPLENLISSDSSRDNITSKHRKSTKNMRNSNSLSFSKSTYSTTSSTSNDSTLSLDGTLLQPVQESESSRQEVASSERKSNIVSSSDITERSSKHIKSYDNANMNDRILVEIRKATHDVLPVVLKKEFIPSVPSVEAATYPALTNVKSNIPTSLCSSLRSDDDEVTVRHISAKIPMTDVAVCTDSTFVDNQSVEKIEVGVNTIIEMTSNMADGSSSSNTASDNSAGQLPKRLFDTVLQRPSLKIVSLRPDGSIVPTDNSPSQHFPSVKEWTPAASEGSAEKSVLPSEEICGIDSESDRDQSEHNGMSGLDSVSASTSRRDPFEEDLNTLANISPLPHS
ncbi:unnamed protein product [Litomosoides sigmodontis]|uniref:Uncharacterized protein n=1 Tax=Litomosoides sigmodontis TaxID=42156 RepID=A0A3P6T8M9_LITSI|nr:unnamed protein product [Litomosoides sigmodontis]